MTTSSTDNLFNELAEQCVGDSQRWFPDVCPKPGDTSHQTIMHIAHHTLAMFGEVGEFANIVKKVERGDYRLDSEAVLIDLGDELTDVLIYLLNIAGILEIDLLAAYNAKREFNERRFGNG